MIRKEIFDKVINWEQTVQIKIKLLEEKLTQSDLAKYFNVSKQMINAVVNGKQEHLILEEKILEYLGIEE